MPIRETDLGHIYAEITVRSLASSSKSWTGTASRGYRGDGHFPSSRRALRKLGIKPSAQRDSYELADGTEQDLLIGFGVVEVLGRAAGGTLVFAGEKEEPLLGVTVLESTGRWLDTHSTSGIPGCPNGSEAERIVMALLLEACYDTPGSNCPCLNLTGPIQSIYDHTAAQACKQVAIPLPDGPHSAGTKDSR